MRPSGQRILYLYDVDIRWGDTVTHYGSLPEIILILKLLLSEHVKMSILIARNPCSSYKLLTEADRERRFTEDLGKSDADDLQPGKWYRFAGSAGFKLSNR